MGCEVTQIQEPPTASTHREKTVPARREVTGFDLMPVSPASFANVPSRDSHHPRQLRAIFLVGVTGQASGHGTGIATATSLTGSP
jgi:hypothetical protein